MPTYTGICRIAGKNGQPNSVRVSDGDMVFDDIDEQTYHVLNIKPPLKDLDWCTGHEP